MRVFCVLSCLVVALAPQVQAQQAPLRVVPQLDLERYVGTWYEVARLPNRFQRACAGDVAATYTLRDDGRITVVNRCREANGTLKEAAGVARRVSGEPPSVLKVRFAPAFLSFLSAVWGDYQVIALSPEYQWAVVGSPDRKYLWFLSRTRALEELTYRTLTNEASAQGFDVSKLMRTEQSR